MCTSLGIGTLRKAVASPLCDSTTNGTPKTQWTPWMALCLTGGSCECKWRVTAALRILITAAVVVDATVVVDEMVVVDGVAGHPGEAAVAVEVMVAVAEALHPAPGGGDVADPAAGVGPVPTAGPDTAGPGPAPTHVPSPPPPKGRPRPQSPRHDPAPGPSPRASPDHVPPPPTKGLGPDLKAHPSLPQLHQQGRTEDRPLKAR